MGTRNLTAVMVNGEYKIAQYGQWDGYPTGQGAAILKFLRVGMTEQFLTNVSGCRFGSDEEVKATWTECGADPVSEFANMAVCKRHDDKYPELSRNTGGKILQMIQERGPLMLANGIEFAGDSLFCEWAYVVDFDKGTFEVYCGFNKAPLDAQERFATAKYDSDRDEPYYPIKLRKSYSLNDLPSEKQFLDDLKDDEE